MLAIRIVEPDAKSAGKSLKSYLRISGTELWGANLVVSESPYLYNDSPSEMFQKGRGPSRGNFQTSPRNTFGNFTVISACPLIKKWGSAVRSSLVNANVARASLNTHSRTAAVDLAGNVVMALDRSLNEHFAICFDFARSR